MYHLFTLRTFCTTQMLFVNDLKDSCSYAHGVYEDMISLLYEKIPINDRNNNKIFFFQQIACLTANKNETSGAFLNSTSQSFYNKFSDKEFSTLLCLRSRS